MSDQCSVIYSSQLISNAQTDFTVQTRVATRPPTTSEETIPIVTSTCSGCFLGFCGPDACQLVTDYVTSDHILPGATVTDLVTSPVATRVQIITQLTPISMVCPSGVNPPPMPTSILTSLPQNGATMLANSTSGRRRSSTTGFSTSVIVVTVNGAPMTSATVVPVVQSEDADDQGSPASIGAIAGGVVGGLVFLFLIGLIVLVWTRQRQRRRDERDALGIGAGERIEDDLWKPEKRHTIRVLPDNFENDLGYKSDERSEEGGGGLSRRSTGPTERVPALPNVDVPEDDDDDEYDIANKRMTPSPHLPPLNMVPSPYGPMPAAYAPPGFPYSGPPAFPHNPANAAPGAPVYGYPPIPQPPSPIPPFDGSASRRASTRMSMHRNGGDTLTRAPTNRTMPTGNEEPPFSPSSTTAVNKRKSFAAGEVHRREKSNGGGEER